MAHAPGLTRNQSLQRAVTILRALSERRSGSPAAAIAATVALPLPTVRRLLATLADAGLVEQVPGSTSWVLGPELLRLGRAADPYVAVVGRARPELVALAEALGEAAILGASRLPYAVDVIDQVDPPRLVAIGSWLGRSIPLHASAGARLALASTDDATVRAIVGPGPLRRYTAQTIVDPEHFLESVREVRATGVAVSVDELEDGLTTVAVPIGSLGPAHVFSIGVSGPTFRLDADRRLAVVQPLRRSATAIAEQLGR